MNTKLIHSRSISRIQQGITSLLVVAALGAVASASAQDIRASVDGSMVRFPDVQPMMMSDRVMVPVRGVFEKMDADVKWNASENTVTAYRGSDTIRLKLNSYTAVINDRELNLDSPAVMHNGRTMVPLRFLSEALGASVDWIAESRLVEIKSLNVTPPGNTSLRVESGTVIPFILSRELRSNFSAVGDRFTAAVDTKGLPSYQGIPQGSIIEGHVDFAQAKYGDTPGVLGLAFDRVRFPNGQLYPVNGSLIGLDTNSVTNDNGRLVAKPKAKSDDIKFVGYGAGAGALLAVITKGNVVNNTVIGAALGYLLGIIQPDPKQAKDVTLANGTNFGVRLTEDMFVRAAVKSGN